MTRRSHHDRPWSLPLTRLRMPHSHRLQASRHAADHRARTMPPQSTAAPSILSLPLLFSQITLMTTEQYGTQGQGPGSSVRTQVRPLCFARVDSHIPYPTWPPAQPTETQCHMGGPRAGSACSAQPVCTCRVAKVASRWLVNTLEISLELLTLSSHQERLTPSARPSHRHPVTSRVRGRHGIPRNRAPPRPEHR